MINRSAINNRSAVRQARALAIQDIERCYRNWMAFILEKRSELAQRQSLDDDDLLGMPQSAQARKARLLPAVREELTAVLRMRQQQSQEAAESAARQSATAAPDPDTVYAALLELISEELAGKHHPQGWALVWYEGELHEFNHQAVMRATNEEDYLITTGGASFPERKQMIIVGLGGVLLLAALVAFGYWMFLYTPTAALSSTMQVSVGQRTVVLWGASAASINGITAPISAQPGYPLRLCITPEQQRVAKPDTSLIITGTESVRVFRLAPSAIQADTLVQDCGSTPARTVAAALLTSTRTYQESGTEISQLTVWGPDTDPAAIPSDRMVVDLTMADADGAEGTLILADGSRYAATTSIPAGKLTTVRYLVPFSPSPQRAGYERIIAGELPAILPLDLPAPTGREALLHEVLRIDSSAAAIETRDGVPTLALTITVSLAADATPLTLIPADVTIAATNGSVLSNINWTPPALIPGEAHELQIALPLSQASSLDIALAGWRARLNLR